MSRGDRGRFWSLHKPRTMPRSPPLPAQTRHNTRGHDLRLQYYFSTVANIYLWDPEWGGPFWKTNAFAPLPVWVSLIGHSVYANDLGIGYTALSKRVSRLRRGRMISPVEFENQLIQMAQAA